MEDLDPIQSEIQRLSLRIAVARYDLEEAILKGFPVNLCDELCKEIAICLLIRSALQRGSYKELPYNVRLLFNS